MISSLALISNGLLEQEEILQTRIMPDQQDRLSMSRLQRRSGRRGNFHGSVLADREEYLEGGSLSGLAVYQDIPTALLDDAIDGRQAEARPSRFILGREKRFEEL